MLTPQNNYQKPHDVTFLKATAVLLFYGALLVLWLWARAQMVAVPLPSHIASLPDGQLLVSFQQHLYPVGPDGSVGEALDLPPIANAVGITAAGADHLFVYRGKTRQPSLLDKLLTFLRADRTIPQPGAEEGIYLCQLSLGSCQLFSRQFVVTGTARMLWDADRQQLIVADTSQHRLLVLDRQGELLKTIDGFEFPNGIWRNDKQLLVADTNHHRIAGVDLDTLSAPLTLTRVHPDGKHLWPFEVAVIGQQYWLLVANHKMEDARLYRYSSDWQLLGPAASRLDDIVNLAPLGRGALVTDLASRSLWRLNAEGQPVAELLLPGLEQAQADYRQWKLVSYTLLALLLVAFVVGLFYAILDERKRRHQATADQQPQQPPQPQAAGPAVWIDHGKTTRDRRMLLLVAGLPLLGLPLVWLAAPQLAYQFFWQLLAVLLIGIAFIANLYLLLTYVGRSALGVKGQDVILCTPAGQQVQGNGQQLRYSDSLLVIGDVIMPLGSLNNTIAGNKQILWDREQLQELLLPALATAQKITWWQAAGLVWKLRFWPLLSSWLLTSVLGLLVLGLWAAKQLGMLG